MNVKDEYRNRYCATCAEFDEYYDGSYGFCDEKEQYVNGNDYCPKWKESQNERAKN